MRRASISSWWSWQYCSKALVVSFASSTEKPFEISVSSPGISVATKPAARIRIYLRASAWLATGATSPLRSLLGSLMSLKGGSSPLSRALYMRDAIASIESWARRSNSARCSPSALLCSRASVEARRLIYISGRLPWAMRSKSTFNVITSVSGPSPCSGIDFVCSVTPTASTKKKQSLLTALGVTLRSCSSPMVRTPRPFI